MKDSFTPEEAVIEYQKAAANTEWERKCKLASMDAAVNMSTPPLQAEELIAYANTIYQWLKSKKQTPAT